MPRLPGAPGNLSRATPETVAGAEKVGKSQTGIGGDGPLAGYDFTDATLRYPDFFGQSVLGYSHGF
jgi:hypothetical protein